MARVAEVEGLGRLEFPDDTPDEVVAATVKRQIGERDRAAIVPTPLSGIVNAYKIAKGIVGDTPGQALATGLMAGGGAATAGLKGLTGLAARTGIGAGAGAAGAAVDQQPIVEGAAKGAVAIPVAEGVLAGGSKLLRSLPGMKGHIANLDAQKVLDWLKQRIGYTSPSAGNASQTLYAATRNEGGAKRFIQDKFGNMVTEADQALLGGINVPSMGSQPVTLQQAIDKLAEIRAAGYGSHLDPLTRTMSGFDARRAGDQLAGEIKTALSSYPELANRYLAENSRYAKGSELLRLLDPQSSFRHEVKGVQFNTPVVQKGLSENIAGAAERMKGAEQPLQEALLRGGQPGSADRLASGSGGMFDALSQVLRGQNTGFSQTWRVPLTTALPNLGSQYAGTAPYTAPGVLKALLDAIAINRATQPNSTTPPTN